MYLINSSNNLQEKIRKEKKSKKIINKKKSAMIRNSINKNHQNQCYSKWIKIQPKRKYKDLFRFQMKLLNLSTVHMIFQKKIKKKLIVPNVKKMQFLKFKNNKSKNRKKIKIKKKKKKISKMQLDNKM